MKLGQLITKARLVARGFEEDSSELRTDSPTRTKQTLRFIMAVCSSKEWIIHSMDISSAFLQGREIQRVIYLRPPSDVCDSSRIWKLRKPIYGLNDVSRAWYQSLKKELLKLDGRMSLLDNALFIWHDENRNLIGILGLHVDDFFYGGEPSWHGKVINSVLRIFKISSQEESMFKYVVQSSKALFVDQIAYIDQLQEVDIENAQDITRPLNDVEQTQLRSIGGQLTWAVSQTRPDMAYDSCRLNNSMKDATVKSLKEANKAIRKIKNHKVRLSFPKLRDIETSKLVVYTDASHASLPDGSSQGALIIFLVDTNGTSVPISWQSKKIRRVTKSPLASETLAMGEGADTAYYLASLFHEIFPNHPLPKIHCITDSKSLVDTMHTTHQLEDKRLFSLNKALYKKTVHFFL